MSNLCIIPARGGSKRIPRKNIKDFLGKPIIAYSIEAALKSNLFDEIMVSTDDEEIAAIAKEYGAKVPFMRSEENADDFATTYDVIEEVLQKYGEAGKKFKNTCVLYPCAPFVTASRLNEAYKKLEEFDTVFPVVKFGFPIQRALKKNEEDKVAFFQPEFELSRSQDLTPSYHDAGQFYWLNIHALKENKRMIAENTGAIVLSEMEVQDIDNTIDWKMAELKYKLLYDIS